MLNFDHLSLLTRSVTDWNQWRMDNPNIQPYLVKAELRGCFDEANLRDANLHGADLRGATFSRTDLSRTDLSKADLRGTRLHWANLDGATLSVAKLYGADLRGATLRKATLNGADLRTASLYEANLRGASLSNASLSNASLYGANLSEADLSAADLSGASLSRATLHKTNLREANLDGANLSEADLSGVDLTGAKLERSILVKTTCNNAIFTGCRVHGISAWDLQLEEAQQTNLIITPSGEPEITVDQLEVAQFIYLLLNNQRIRHVIDTITSKVVLILGRFTPERKVVLDAIRNQLRRQDYLPVLFDFEKPRSQTTLDTINTLAGMARFVIADITDAKSVLQELTMIVPHRPLLPIQPVLLSSQEEPGMFDFFRAFPWFLKTLLYRDQKELLESLQVKVILPAEQKAKELITSQH